MKSLEFSVPYNYDPQTLQDIFRFKNTGGNKITEIYLAGPQKYSGTGRVLFEEVKPDDFFNAVDLIHKEGIRVNLVFNSTCEGEDWYSQEVVNSTIEYIKLVHEGHGIEAITIANPLYIHIIKEHFPRLEICASVLADIDCVQRALIYQEAGVDVITADININRDLQVLKEIEDATHAKLKLMVNEGCIYKCPFRKFHFNYVSHKSKQPVNFKGETPFFNNCYEIYNRDHSQIFKSRWIRPEDTRKYSEITNFFKIVGRVSTRNTIIRDTKAYLTESWHGNLLDIVDASLHKYKITHSPYVNNKSLDKYNFFEKVTTCGNKCSQCNYCNELAKKLITFGIG